MGREGSVKQETMRKEITDLGGGIPPDEDQLPVSRCGTRNQDRTGYSLGYIYYTSFTFAADVILLSTPTPKQTKVYIGRV